MMIRHALFRAFLAVLVLALAATAAQAEINFDMVPVGNTLNTADSTGYGPVGYAYSIGTYEVTAGQYTAFLNAVAATDTYGLYNTDMWSSTYGCKIQQSGSSGSYTYSVASDWADRPVNYVSWADAARFCNWLHNGQPTGAQDNSSTEDGAYYVNGATTNQSALIAITRKADALFFIPTEDEWYKAAYHKNDGDTGNYFDYPTSSDSADTSMANYGSSVGNTTDVGSYAYPSPYGTFDQGGNVFEWNEAVIGNHRGSRGGSWNVSDNYLHASTRYDGLPEDEKFAFGFRVASAVPEPGSLAMLAGLLAMGLIGYWCQRRRLSFPR